MFDLLLLLPLLAAPATPAQIPAAKAATKTAKTTVTTELKPNIGWRYVSHKGDDLGQPFIFDNGPDPFVEARARIQGKNTVGVIDNQGALIVALGRYTFISRYKDGQAAVCTNCTKEFMGEHWRMIGGQWGFVDLKGKQLGPLKPKR